MVLVLAETAAVFRNDFYLVVFCGNMEIILILTLFQVLFRVDVSYLPVGLTHK